MAISPGGLESKQSSEDCRGRRLSAFRSESSHGYGACSQHASGGPCIVIRTTPEDASVTFCRELATRLVALTFDHPIRLGIDGVDAAGKPTLANVLGAALTDLGRPVVRASIDGFHRPRTERYRLGRHSPEGYYRDSVQNEAVTACVLAPLGPRGSCLIRRAVFDYRTDRAVNAPEETVPADAILVFDGIFLHRPELRPYWDATIYLDAPFTTTVARAALRDGSPAVASIIVDNTDLSAPRIVALRPPFSEPRNALHTADHASRTRTPSSTRSEG